MGKKLRGKCLSQKEVSLKRKDSRVKYYLSKIDDNRAQIDKCGK